VLANREALGRREQSLAIALVALIRDDAPQACAEYRRLVSQNENDFVAWMGMGECESRDRAVLKDPASPTGWRFRSSIRSAITAYQRASALLPSSNLVFKENAFSRLRDLLFTGANQIRGGRGFPDDSILFAAMASWDERGDTLAFIPYRFSELPRVVPKTLAIAISRNRAAYYTIANAWVDAFPDSPDALEARALAEEGRADTAAIATVQRARRLATDPSLRLRMAAAEVWLRLRFGVGRDASQVSTAKALADSLVRSVTTTLPDDASRLASIAVLAGRLPDAIRLLRMAAVDQVVQLSTGQVVVPRSIVADVDQLTLHAALVDAPESLSVIATRVRGALRSAVATQHAREIERTLLSRAAMLAFAGGAPSQIGEVDAGANDLLRAQHALQRGDTAAVKSALAAIRATRADLPPAEVTMDALYPEAALLAEIGDGLGASQWLDATLRALPFAPPEFLRGFEQSASFLRALALRERLRSTDERESRNGLEAAKEPSRERPGVRNGSSGPYQRVT
jgi:hypothetical protein